MDTVLTIIPARGGSKSVPNKNIKELAGQPLIAWIARAVQEAGNAGRIIVSTDSEEIAEVARALHLEVPFLRPADIAQDLSTDLEFVLHALDFFKDKEGWEPKVVARFSPVTPFVTPETVRKSIELLLANPDIHSVRPIARLSHHPYKAWRIEGEYMVPAFPKEITGFDEPHNLPRQLFPEMYAHLGAAGVAWTPVHTQLRSTSGSSMKYVLIDDAEAFDINHPMDFQIADALMRMRTHG
jgi:CMP-N,N'-diacetyllegionaminic acid synthase